MSQDKKDGDESNAPKGFEKFFKKKEKKEAQKEDDKEKKAKDDEDEEALTEQEEEEEKKEKGKCHEPRISSFLRTISTISHTSLIYLRVYREGRKQEKAVD